MLALNNEPDLSMDLALQFEFAAIGLITAIVMFMYIFQSKTLTFGIYLLTIAFAVGGLFVFGELAKNIVLTIQAGV